LKVVQGLATLRPGPRDVDDVARLWRHESSRVFQDRLISEDDNMEFTDFADSLLHTHFQTQWRPTPETNPLRYGDFLRTGGEARRYEQIRDGQKLNRILYDYMSEYNSQTVSGHSALRLVLFQEAVDHLCNILRGCRFRCGHVLLIGSVGSGRRSLCTLAAFIMDARRCVLDPLETLDIYEFTTFLKGAMRVCGIKGQSTMLLISDEEVVEEAFLDNLSTLINVGHVPDIWNLEEIENIQREIQCLMEANQNTDEDQSEEDSKMKWAWRVFLTNLQEHMHVVLAWSPNGDRLRRQCRQFPSLVSCTTVDYMGNWPEEALLSVAAVHFEGIAELAGGGALASVLPSSTVAAYRVARRTAKVALAREGRKMHVGPQSHLALVQLYGELLRRKSSEHERSRRKLISGLSKLRSSFAWCKIWNKSLWL